MKLQNYFTVGLLLVSITTMGLIAIAVGQTQSGQNVNDLPASKYRLSGPYTHKNLTIFLVHGEDLVKGHNFLTLQEALAQKKVVVYETKDVNELAIRNFSDQDVYVQSGDIVRGGDQDRMIETDFIVPAKSGRMPIAAFCVESGRWSKRGNEANANFTTSDNSASTRELKLAAKQARSQQEVWNKVSVAQAKLSENVGAKVQSVVSASSLELSMENAQVKENASEYIDALSKIIQSKSDVIGYAFAINGHVNSADVYASKELFAKLWPKLLKATAVEAIAELQKDQQHEPVADEAIMGFFADLEKADGSEKDVTPRVKVLTRENDKNIFFETRDRKRKDAWIHRNYIRK